jgi:hypothetical protein
MNKGSTKLTSFPLRLPITMRRQAGDLAQREGLSLNHFISLAVAEKIVRMESAPRTSDFEIVNTAASIKRWSNPLKQ